MIDDDDEVGFNKIDPCPQTKNPTRWTCIDLICTPKMERSSSLVTSCSATYTWPTVCMRLITIKSAIAAITCHVMSYSVYNSFFKLIYNKEAIQYQWKIQAMYVLIDGTLRVRSHQLFCIAYIHQQKFTFLESNIQLFINVFP